MGEKWEGASVAPQCAPLGACAIRRRICASCPPAPLTAWKLIQVRRKFLRRTRQDAGALLRETLENGNLAQQPKGPQMRTKRLVSSCIPQGQRLLIPRLSDLPERGVLQCRCNSYSTW